MEGRDGDLRISPERVTNCHIFILRNLSTDLDSDWWSAAEVAAVANKCARAETTYAQLVTRRS